MDWTREDLENKSKEELIDIIMNIQEDLEYFPDLYDGTYDDYEEQRVRREISLFSRPFWFILLKLLKVDIHNIRTVLCLIRLIYLQGDEPSPAPGPLIRLNYKSVLRHFKIALNGKLWACVCIDPGALNKIGSLCV